MSERERGNKGGKKREYYYIRIVSPHNIEFLKNSFKNKRKIRNKEMIDDMILQDLAFNEHLACVNSIV